MTRRTALVLFLALGLVAAATPALAEKGGNGKGNAPSADTTSSSIAIATITSATPNALTSATPAYGDTLTFATTVEPLAGWEYPMVAVSCYQDVNGDGTVDTNVLGPDVVFGLLDKPDADFTLAGSSKWADRGGDAVCRADLYAYGWKGGQESIRSLATTGEWTATA